MIGHRRRKLWLPDRTHPSSDFRRRNLFAQAVALLINCATTADVTEFRDEERI
jgi:hypothetical protein